MKEGPSCTVSVDHLVHIAWVNLEGQPLAKLHMAEVEHMLEAA